MTMWPPLTFAIDFDGTITKENEYPTIGEFKPHCIEVLKKLKAGHNKIILWTCRQGEELEAAVEAVRAQGFEFDAVNESLWVPKNAPATPCTFRKVFADVYVDDAAYPFDPKTQGDDFWLIFAERFKAYMGTGGHVVQPQ